MTSTKQAIKNQWFNLSFYYSFWFFCKKGFRHLQPTTNQRIMKNMEMLNLTWHCHTDTLSDALKELSVTHHFADVTLITDDNKHLKAHKSILNCFIPGLRENFDQQNQE